MNAVNANPARSRLTEAGLAYAALAYAALGWPVFPLVPGGKLPLIKKRDGGRGVHDAITDPAMVRGWWDREPKANIGLACGAWCWVLDIDSLGMAATEPDGLDSFAALTTRYGRLPPTMMQITGGGGYQYLFAPDARIKNGVKFLPGLDTRSAGGYIAAPPSIHPSGRAYYWRPGYGPGEIEIARAPEWLIAVAEPLDPADLEPAAAAAPKPNPIASLDRYAAAALAKACDAIAGASPGRQEDTLAHEAYGIGRLVAGDVVPADTARAHLAAAGARMANQPGRRPWTPTEIEWRIARAFTAASARPRNVEIH